ncbi:uncharacterized protein LOC105735055 [Apis florea]|uniref:uncharacterized protein LOC105735055 n=1 Tax=Apis florea TaxID=7463 RepID=UPI000629CFD4|nr:uncharacterized protein LOC105735055 [Apis florea]
MSGKLKISVSSCETAISNSSRVSSNTKTKCCQLFLSCFKINRKKESLEDIMDDNVKEYDYIVEKLVVKRVPFVLFSMPKNVLENKINSETRNNSNEETPQSQTKLTTMYSTASETQSLLYYSDRFDQNISLDISNKCSHPDTNRALLNERNRKHTFSDNYHTRITELMNTLSSLHPNLKEEERPPKDPYPLNISQNKSVLSTKMSLKEFLNKNNEHQMKQTFKSQTFVQEPFLKKRESRNVNCSEINSKGDKGIYCLNQMKYITLDDFQDNCASIEKPIIQSVHKISCNSTNFVKSIINTNQMNTEDYKSINNHLQWNHQSLVNQSKTLLENITKTDTSKIILRWNIILKHYKSKTYSSKTSQKLSKYFNIS